MSELLLSQGTSLSPLLSIGPEDWAQYCAADANREVFLRGGETISFAELKKRNGDRFASETTPAEFERRSVLAQRHLTRLSEELAQTNPDVVVIVADDHGELFDGTALPPIAVYISGQVSNSVGDQRTMAYLSTSEDPAWRRNIKAAPAVPTERCYPGHPDFAFGMVSALIERAVDAGVAKTPTDPNRGIGYAFGFVINRLLGGRAIPVVPVLLNTWYPPNVPLPSRCYDIGVAIREAIEVGPPDTRVAVICAGGLSHIGIDQDLDRQLLEAIRANSRDEVAAIPRLALQSGNCQLLNWAVLGGIVSKSKNHWLEYLPVYRTAAGTGIGLAFGSWS